MPYLWIALGSALGGAMRHWLSGAVAAVLGDGFPWGTLAVNVSGSFVIGCVAGATEASGGRFLSPDARLFLTAGLCGGYTTFSGFSLQTLELARGGDMLGAGLNIALSTALCIAAAWLGYAAFALFCRKIL
jgi:CrcB protein